MGRARERDRAGIRRVLRRRRILDRQPGRALDHQGAVARHAPARLDDRFSMCYQGTMMAWSAGVAAMVILASAYGMASANPPTHSDAGFVLIVGGELKTAKDQRPIVGAKLIHADDQLVLTISASRAVNVFVAYCDSQATQQVYSAVLAGPDLAIDVPFVADNHPGREHVFVVASAEPLQSSDPKLDRILRAPDREHVCGDALAMTTKQSHERTSGKASGGSKPAAVAPPPEAGVLASPGPPSNYPAAAGGAR